MTDERLAEIEEDCNKCHGLNNSKVILELIEKLRSERKNVEVLHGVLETIKRYLETESNKKERQHLIDYIDSFKDVAV